MDINNPTPEDIEKEKAERKAYWEEYDRRRKAGLCTECGFPRNSKKMCTNPACRYSKHVYGCPCAHGVSEDQCTCKLMAMQEKHINSCWIDDSGQLHIGSQGYLDFATAEKWFAGARSPEKGRPISSNVRLMKRGESYAIKLFNTDIITIHPDNTFTLRTGGWFTITTGRWMDAYAPVRTYSDCGVWYIVKRGESPY
jgi:hypothetical protein